MHEALFFGFSVIIFQSFQFEIYMFVYQYRAISKSLNQKSNPQTKPQYRAEQTPNPNIEQTKPQTQTEQTKPTVTSLAARSSSSFTANRPSLQIAELLRCSVLMLPPSRYFSLFFSLTLSVSLSLSESEMKTTK